MLFFPTELADLGSLRGKLIEVVCSGRQDSIVYANVRDFFRILVQGLDTGVDSIRKGDIVKTLSNEGFVGAIWKTITARGIQQRMQISFIRGRDLLIQNGVREELLPLTDDLRLRTEEEKSRDAPNPPNASQLIESNQT
jgi:hypothetical protein